MNHDDFDYTSPDTLRIYRDLPFVQREVELEGDSELLWTVYAWMRHYVDTTDKAGWLAMEIISDAIRYRRKPNKVLITLLYSETGGKKLADHLPYLASMWSSAEQVCKP